MIKDILFKNTIRKNTFKFSNLFKFQITEKFNFSHAQRVVDLEKNKNIDSRLKHRIFVNKIIKLLIFLDSKTFRPISYRNTRNVKNCKFRVSRNSDL